MATGRLLMLLPSGLARAGPVPGISVVERGRAVCAAILCVSLDLSGISGGLTSWTSSETKGPNPNTGGPAVGFREVELSLVEAHFVRGPLGTLGEHSYLDSIVDTLGA